MTSMLKHQLSESDKRYILQQIQLFNQFTQCVRTSETHTGTTIFQKRRENALWSIASKADLFGAALDPTGKLTDSQWNEAIDFIEQFDEHRGGGR